ncbi:cleavage stimulating factor 64-like, partial [Vicia villosa]|uniref:cleavage stimulating factor 64-like n=1 Tax=Vicia villosa TaxID=3911 RepID=UPI00273CC895
FQEQIMLGMVQSPQAVPKAQPVVPQNSQQTVQPTQQPSVQPAPLLPGKGGTQDQAGVSHTHIPPRKHQNQPSVPVSYSTVPATSHQSQLMVAHSMQMPQQPKGHLTPQVAPETVLQSSQLPKIPPPSVHSSSQPHHPTQMPTASSQQPLQTPGQVGNMPFRSDFGSQAENSMQIDRGSSWMPGPSENLSQHSGPPGPPSMVSGQMGAANQSLRPPALTPDMEKALLQQVMSLTPEQINLLPPEQRNQVLQLQLMLRK